MVDHRVFSPATLQAACDAAKPGDRILVHGGLYDLPSRLRGKRGAPDKPIVISAADERWISGGQAPNPYWGGAVPSADAPAKPAIADFAFLVIDGCAHVVIEGLKVRDCWPTILFIKDTSNLTVRRCALRHATYALFAKGKATTHLLIEDNEWRQDDSPDHLLWRVIDWSRAHGNEGSDGLYRYFNGAFLAGKSVRGNIVVRRNRIMDAYNGIRLKADDAPPPLGRVGEVNANVHIFDNDFIRIRDNPVEPEVAAFNWHVRHNRVLDCHSWFSFDGVTGGYWYFYGNTGRFESRQGLSDDAEHTMGRVLKLSYEATPRDSETEGVPSLPWFVFNNSWHLRCPLIGGKTPPQPEGAPPLPPEGPDFTANLDFFNNAFDWCRPAPDDPRLCKMIDLVHNFDFARSHATRFDYSISDRADYFAGFPPGSAAEAHGIAAAGPIFIDAASGRFAPAPASQAVATGWVRDVALPSAGAALRVQADGTLNRGALQDYGLIQVPALEGQAAALLAEMVPRS